VIDLLVAIPDSVPIGAGGPEEGLALEVLELDIDIPIEARLGDDGELLATPPRGTLATGFDLPHGRLIAKFDVRSSE
jgi:hypothetical protein